ncbi:HD domain-containing phosphohydrolase [Legionella tunisiensis]|uniref:HD domain-containing phosphohydrolase n=1 Tax=Legionella tunisiensis TaxID=1034944 RepID=UPI0002F62BA5|nr:HD domain-containing phosphohydrolase [Legionella tunisiensis]
MSTHKEHSVLFDAMSHVLSLLENPVLLCDAQATILYANHSYCNLIDSNPQGIKYWQVFPKGDETPDYFKTAVISHKEIKQPIHLNTKTFIVRVVPVTKIIAQQTIYMVYFEEITTFLNMEQQIELDKEILANSFFNAIRALSELVETRDPYTAGHQKRTASIALHIAKKANLSELNFMVTLYLGALIHDVGKIYVPVEYLITPRKLEPFEYEILKQHVNKGSEIVSKIVCPWDIEVIVSQHHERLDGSGYPKGLKKDEINKLAQIVAVADVWEAMITHRPYRAAHTIKEAVDYLNSTAGVLFDKNCVDCLLSLVQEEIDIYSQEFFSFLNFKTFFTE